MRIISAVAASFLLFSFAVPAQAQQAYDIGMRQKAEKRFDEARISFGAACDAGSSKACNEYGDMLEDGTGGAADPAAAKTYYAKACAADIGDACAGQGTILNREKASAAAEPLLAKACNLGSTRGCSNLGVLYERGNLGTADLAKAARYYEKSCALGSGVGCHNRAFLVRDGKGEPADRARAQGLFAANCEAKKFAQSCVQAGLLLSSAKYDEKIKFYDIACDNDILLACFNLGAVHVKRIAQGNTIAEMERDRDLGAKAYAKACELGDKEACGKRPRIRANDRIRVGSVQAKRSLVAYQPRAHGCDFSNVVWYDNDPASERFARNRLNQNRQCVNRWTKTELSRLNSIVQDVEGYVHFSDESLQTYLGVSKVCECMAELTAAVERYDAYRDRLVARFNRRQERFNRDLRS